MIASVQSSHYLYSLTQAVSETVVSHPCVLPDTAWLLCDPSESLMCRDGKQQAQVSHRRATAAYRKCRRSLCMVLSLHVDITGVSSDACLAVPCPMLAGQLQLKWLQKYICMEIYSLCSANAVHSSNIRDNACLHHHLMT